MKHHWIAAGLLAAVGGALLSLPRASTAAGAAPDDWNRLVDKAVGFLRTTQDPAGSWSGQRSPGVTGIVLTGMLKTGRVGTDDKNAALALKYIESLIDAKAGHIAGANAKVNLHNYVTSVNVIRRSRSSAASATTASRDRTIRIRISSSTL